jgi:hypothetical protein
VHEVNREIGDAIEEWVKTRLDELVPADDIESFARAMAEIHQEVSGAERIEAKADARSIVLDVFGCNNLHACKIRMGKKKVSGCIPDMIVAAIIQRALDTPVRMEVIASDIGCTKRFTPAWLVDLLSDLDTYGAEGMVVIYNDRILYSHLPSEIEAEALSESVLLNEESPGEEDQLVVRKMVRRDARIMLMKFGKVFVSVCLRPEADEDRIQAQVAGAIQRVAEVL